MSATSKKIRTTKGASGKQYADIACRKGKRKFSDGCAAIEAERNESDLTGRGFSRGARMWHRYTDGGEPICDVCKRVGHVAKSCWQRKASLSVRRRGCGENVLHSVVSKMVGFESVKRHISVSVNTQRVEALLDFSAMENAVSYESVKVDPKLKIYDLRDRERANSAWRLGARGMVWLPVVIGSRSDKLRCVVVEGLTEKLIIGLPGLSYLGASIDFTTGDVRIGHRGRKKVKGNTMAKNSDELHEDHVLVRDAKMKCKESRDAVTSKDVSSKKGHDEKRKECTKSQVSEQVKDLAVKDEELRDADRVKVPNQKKKNDDDPVSGRGRKEGKVNVVSPKQDKVTTTITTTTTITPDHDDEKSEGEWDSEDEDSSDPEELVTCCTGSAKTSKSTSKAKRKKSKKRKKGRRKR